MDHESITAIKPRMYFIGGVFCILFCILLAGLFKVQMLDYQELMDKQERQNYRRILIPGPRGDIYDRDGRLLVGNRPLFSAVVYLNELRTEFRKEYYAQVRKHREDGNQSIDRDVVAVDARQRVVQRYMDKIDAILGTNDVIDSSKIEQHFSRELLLPFVLQNDLTPEQYARLIEQLPIDSEIQIVSESARYYPYGPLAAHALGYVVATEEVHDENVVGGEDLRTFRFKGKAGRTGMELAFDEQLQGSSGGEVWVVDPSGFQHRRVEYKAPVKGNNIFSSIDADIQAAAEKALGDRTGAAVAMDIRTGEVLALVSEPGYDLNLLSPYIPSSVYNDIRDRGAWLNRAIQGLYPPGSTFKIVTSVAGFMHTDLDDDYHVNCPGYLMVGNRRFHCDVRTGHGDIEIRHAIGDSCNVFFYTLGLKIGVENLAATARMFGLDKPTGIELPNETRRSVVPDTDYKKRRFYEGWYAGDTANYSIGQGYLLVTPLQMCAFTASFARRMTHTTPTILRVSKERPHELGGEPLPISDDQYQAIMDGMRLCVSEGTGRLVQRNVTMPVSGKTGTAQIHISGRESTIAWFICFAPSDNPQIAVAITVEGTDPGDNLFGGSTSAPIAREILRAWEAKHLP
ncbi:MAG: penicillin-binding protein 2 [Opitutales bacterium]|nr:penicillin-binding protein 2 [Opitutales bacterium]